jgi:hypothetical protein
MCAEEAKPVRDSKGERASRTCKTHRSCYHRKGGLTPERRSALRRSPVITERDSECSRSSRKHRARPYRTTALRVIVPTAALPIMARQLANPDIASQSSGGVADMPSDDDLPRLMN